MTTSLTVDQIVHLFEQAGTRLYGGEAITQTEHALQAAWFAEKSGADDYLIIACLLHDLGHMLFEQNDDDLAQGKDDRHESRVLPYLSGILPSDVTGAIRLHVDAKRYLCHQDKTYHATLSEASKLSLALQGGPMDAENAALFVAQPQALRAIELRRYDDAAKIVGLSVPPLAYYLPRLMTLIEKTSVQ